ncbi:hypothetical protein ABG067_008653, partial [Albugo candida]
MTYDNEDSPIYSTDTDDDDTYNYEDSVSCENYYQEIFDYCLDDDSNDSGDEIVSDYEPGVPIFALTPISAPDNLYVISNASSIWVHMKEHYFLDIGVLLFIGIHLFNFKWKKFKKAQDIYNFIFLYYVCSFVPVIAIVWVL